MNTTHNTIKNYFLSQPHQPFFLLAIANAIIVMLLFLLSYKGIITLTIDTLTFHSYTIIFLLFLNGFTGFLFTTFPRFNQSQVIEKDFYTTIFYSNLIGSIGVIVGAIVSPYMVYLSIVTLFVSHGFNVYKLYEIYKQGYAHDKSDSYWILIASAFGLVGHALFFISLFLPDIQNSAIILSFYMYTIFLAFSVGQRMIPFFSHSFAQKNPKFVPLVFDLFLLLSFSLILELQPLTLIINLLLGGYMAYEIKRWELHPLQSPPILWVLHVALFWLPLSFILGALSVTAEMFLETSFYFLTIHLLALGFLTTVLIGFGTRVILGHSNQAPHGDTFATKIFLGVQLIVLLRALYSFNIAFGWGTDFLFDITATAWILLFVLWGGRYSATLLYGKKL